MAAKTKQKKPKAAKAPRAPLTTQQRLEAKFRYIYGLEEPWEIAAVLGLDLRTVKAFVTKFETDKRRIWSSPEVQAVRAEQVADMADRRGRMETKCASLAEVRIDAQTTVASKLAIEAASAKGAQVEKGYLTDTQAVARALGSAAPDIEKARLSVGLTTDKPDNTDDSALSRYWEARLGRLETGPAAAGEAGQSSGLVPCGAVGAEPVAGEGEA